MSQPPQAISFGAAFHQVIPGKLAGLARLGVLLIERLKRLNELTKHLILFIPHLDHDDPFPDLLPYLDRYLPDDSFSRWARQSALQRSFPFAKEQEVEEVESRFERSPCMSGGDESGSSYCKSVSEGRNRGHAENG